MTQQFGMGARLLTQEEAKDADLGALAQLPGVWKSAPVPADLIAQGWNVIAVPGPNGFVLEVIPYVETLKFSPVVISAGNRGPIINGNQVEQNLTGLIYEQSITSVCPAGSPCVARGFPSGTAIHAETGLFLNVLNANGGLDIARLATIPHGNSVLALGTSAKAVNPDNGFFPVASSLPRNLDGSPASKGRLGYTDPYLQPQFKVFNQQDPNTFLKAALGTSKISAMTTLAMTTRRSDAGGGILNLPFIATNVNATSLDAIFWIQTIEGSCALQMQYTQTIDLVFPPAGSPTPIVWPHITVNTLVKQA